MRGNFSFNPSKTLYFSQKKDFFTSNFFVYFIYTSCIHLNFYPFYIISLCYHYSDLDDTNTDHLEQEYDPIPPSNDDTVMPPPDNVSLSICASNVFEDDEECAVGEGEVDLYFVDNTVPIEIVHNDKPEDIPGTSTDTPASVVKRKRKSASQLPTDKLKKQRSTKGKAKAPIQETDSEVFTYEDKDTPNTLPNFTPSRPPGPQIHQVIKSMQSLNSARRLYAIFLASMCMLVHPYSNLLYIKIHTTLIMFPSLEIKGTIARYATKL